MADAISWLAAGRSYKDTFGACPELTEDDIRACLAFAADRERRVLTADTITVFENGRGAACLEVFNGA